RTSPRDCARPWTGTSRRRTRTRFGPSSGTCLRGGVPLRKPRRWPRSDPGAWGPSQGPSEERPALRVRRVSSRTAGQGGATTFVPRRTVPCRLRRVLRDSISAYPSVFLPLARWRYPHKESRVVTRPTELVIEGFARSANTFAVEAFERVQPRPVRIVHHLHAPAHIMPAVSLGSPAIATSTTPQATRA